VLKVTGKEDLEDLDVNSNGVYGFEKNSAGSKLSKVDEAVIDIGMGFQVAIKTFHFPGT
jgi:hypothetical protein